MGRRTRPSSYLRQSRRHQGATPTGLVSGAGRAADVLRKPTVDALEPRQMLFALTLTANDLEVAPGRFYREIDVEYGTPYLFTQIEPTDGTPQTRAENFDDDPLGFVANGQVMLGSGVRVLHTITPPNNISIINATNDPNAADRVMRARFQAGGQSMTFRVQSSDTDFGAQGLAFSSMAFDIRADTGSSVGLDTDNTTVDLVFGGQVVQSLTGAQLRAASSSGTGVGVFTFTANPNSQNPAFDEIRFRSTGPAAQDAFRIANISALLPAGRFAAIVDARTSAFKAAIVGPLGATAEFFDLYGRPMLPVQVWGIPEGSQVPASDPDDNGIPNFNDGIGRIVLRNTDASTTFTLIGGEFVEEEGGRVFQFADSLETLDFEQAGFGFAFSAETDTVVGLPPNGVTVVVGSPYVRPLNNYNPAGLAPGQSAFVDTGFTRTDQGIFVEGSIGSINIPGAIMGSSRVSGAAGSIAFGVMLGSLTVDGDLGQFVSTSDAGLWVIDPGTDFGAIDVSPVIRTGSQLIVGRTLGEVLIGGRSQMDVTVVGDVNSPGTRPARETFQYNEREVVYGIDRDAEVSATIERAFTNAFGFIGGFFRSGGQALFYNQGYYRNDTLLGSEFVGNAGAGVQISGDLGGADPVNNGVDDVDVYAFPVTGLQDVVVELNSPTGDLYYRIVDENGRTLSAVNLSNELGQLQKLTFTPPQAGVYYLVVSFIAPDADEEIDRAYTMTILGMAPVTFGAYTVAGSSGQTGNGLDFTNTITLLSGSMGAVRVGVGAVDADGNNSDPSPAFNFVEDNADARVSLSGGTFTIAGSLYNISLGNDVGRGDLAGEPTIIFEIGGDLGTFITGLSGEYGREVGFQQGDISAAIVFNIGGRAGTFDIRGAVGFDQDNATDPLTRDPDGRIFVNTGRRGGDGSIGMFRVGSHVFNDNITLNTTPGSIIGGYLISQDAPVTTAGDYGIALASQGTFVTTGFNSDIRFFDTPRIDLRNSVDSGVPLLVGTFQEFVDDGGGRVRIRVVANNVPAGVVRGFIRVLPVNGSQGVAIGRIDQVDLSGGAALEIESIGNAGAGDVISIGRIVIIAADAGSGVSIRGNIETDVWRIEQRAGGAMQFISNQTPRGDIVAADVQGLTSLDITTGDLGRTQLPAWGPKLIGPFLGVQRGPGTEANSAFGIAANAMFAGWNGNLYRPVGDVGNGPASAALDDLGGPLDGFLNGIVIRTGNIDDVRVGGAIGDVILQGGNIARLTANFDRVTPNGRFDGIVGNIFANSIFLVNVGDGLAASGRNQPIATTGITANDDIATVEATLPGSFLSSNIIAANNVIQGGQAFNGIQLVRVDSQGGDFRDGYIGGSRLDDFWLSFVYGDGRSGAATINEIRGRNADFFRMQSFAGFIESLNLDNGFYDASDISATGGMGVVRAAGFRNSTLVGDSQEFRFNRIIVANNMERLTTNTLSGDISDLLLDVSGSILTDISARNLTRVRLDVDGQIPLIRTEQAIRGSLIVTGRLADVDARGGIQTTAFNVAGPIDRVTAGTAIVNSQFNSTGPFGRIGRIVASTFFSGSVQSAGEIDRIEVTGGDAIISVTTTTPVGTVNLLRASRDLDLTSDIAGTVNTIEAGRHIGNRARPNVILVRGNLQEVRAGGQLYSDLRIGQAVDRVSIGIVSSRPQDNQLGSGSIIAFGRINRVTVLGDFAGDITSYSGGIGEVSITGGTFHARRTIAAYSGHIDNVTITAGHLLGNVHADWILFQVNVIGTADGVFGDIGVNPALSSGIAYDQFRNQLPVGVAPTAAVDGPTISAGWNVGVVNVTNGSMFETSVIAGRAIGFVAVRGGSITNDNLTPTLGTAIVAGDSIFAIGVPDGSINLAWILAGPTNLGADKRPGGVGLNADTVKSGFINDIFAGASMFAVVVSAGMLPGQDGIYNTGDDLVSDGVSFVNFVTSPAKTAVSVYSDSLSLSVLNDASLFKSGINLALAETRVDPGFGVAGPQVPAEGLAFTWGADSGTIFFAGPGQAFWDPTGGRVVLYNTSLFSSLTIVSNTGVLTDFDIVTNDDASVGNIVVQATLRGGSDVIVDAFLQSLQTGHYEGTGDIKTGGDVGSLIFGDFRGGLLSARQLAGVIIAGDFGAANPGVRNEARMNFLAAGGITVVGSNRGTVNVERDASGMVFGRLDNALVRSGTSVGGLTVNGEINESRVSVGDFMGDVTVNGRVFDSQIMIGGDLGSDADVGGVGINADRVRTGFAGNVRINGDFAESDLVAGRLRGPDGFFGTADDSVGDGRSSIGTVTITGTRVGSNRLTESYRISSTGTLGAVLIGGQPGGPQGNFIPEVQNTTVLPLQVKSLNVSVDSQIFTGRIEFNQPVDFSTVSSALSVSEVRSSTQLVRLVEGVDYTLRYDAATNTVLVVFSRDVTSRNLPQVPGTAGPGVFRFDLSQALLRAQLAGQRLDGSGEGFPSPGDDYSQDTIVGDAGDKVSPGVVNKLDPITNLPIGTVNFYGPASLDQVLDNNFTPDGLPDTNRVFTIRGSVGDHPDNDTNNFRFAGDVDLYTITLQAGQILRLSKTLGSAAAALVRVITPSGDVLLSEGSDQATTLPITPQGEIDLSPEQNYLIKITGQYRIYVGNADVGVINNTQTVPNLDPVPSGVGDYAFTLQVYDDGDSGFSASTESGNGTNLVNAPSPSDFAGPGGIIGDGNDLPEIVIGGYRFTFDAATGIVSGTNGGSIGSYRLANGQQVSIVDAAIGPSRTAGLPGTVFPDVDIYHLNNRLSVTPGTRLTVTVRLTQFGSDLGARNQNITEVDVAATADYRGSVQFGLFQTSDSTTADDGKLVFAPTAFSPNGGTPNTLIADDGSTRYGYDGQGDFFISFLAPSRFGAGDTTPATYAVYLQGAYQADYRLEVTTDPGTAATTRLTQNVLLEFNGGSVNWLEVAGQVTTLSGFDPATLGFTGTTSTSQPVIDFVKTALRDRLQQVFTAAGLDVRFSFNPADFEFQDFSTVYISNSVDPLSAIFTSFAFGAFTTQGFGAQPYGFSQGSDALNANTEDEAVVFVPSFSLLGLSPSEQDLSNFTTSLTAAVGRRVGELLGLRLSAPDGGVSPDIFNTNSVASRPAGPSYSVPNTARLLSSTDDLITRTDFYLGQQNAVSLLDRVLRRV